MNIGHFAPDIWKHGGIASYIRRLGAAQAARGHEVWYLDRQETGIAPLHDHHLIVHSDADLYDRFQSLKFDVLHLHKPTDGIPDADLPCVRTMHGNQGSCPSGTRFLSRTETACDRTYSLPGCLWGHFVEGCGSRHPKNLLNSFRGFHHEVNLASRMPTMTVSRFLHDEMIRAGCSPEHLRVIPSPAPVVEMPLAPLSQGGVPRFLFLGRIVPQKGVAWLLRAVARTAVPIHVDIAGDGYALPAMRRLADKLGVADRVTFHGWVDPTQVPDLLRRARALVFPSIWHEPAGLTTLEAAAHARPVIASTVGGIPEYAHPDFSLLVTPNDTEGLSEALTILATDADRAAHMGQQGQTHARHTFSMEKFIDQIEAFYQQILDTAPQRDSGLLPSTHRS